MKRMMLVLPLVAVSAALTACDDDARVHVRHSAYAGDYDDADFYYVRSRPYSRYYGPLVLRDGRYYYSSGGAYRLYDRPSRTVVRRSVVRRDFDDDDRRVVVRRSVVDDGDRRVVVRRRAVTDEGERRVVVRKRVIDDDDDD